MPDNKKPPENNPARVTVLEPNEEPPKTGTYTSPPGGKPPTSGKTTGIFSSDTGPEAELVGGPEDGTTVSLIEAQKYLTRGFGYIDLQTGIKVVPPQPAAADQQPPHRPNDGWIQIPFGPERGKWVTEREYAAKYGPPPQTQRQSTNKPPTTKTRLAQETLPTPDNPEIISPYPKEIQERLDTYKKLSEQMPTKEVKELQAEAIKEAEYTKAKQYGPIPQGDLPVVEKMFSEFKNLYFRGYAEAMEQGKELGRKYAPGIEEAQLYGMRYGMSSLTNLHHGLDEASWNFFFALLGPLGDELHRLKQQKIGWTMKYYRSALSPVYLDYLMKTLPEEKAFELAYDLSKKSIYYLLKVAGPLNPISKITYYDNYGRKTYSKYTLSPLVKINSGLFSLSSAIERLTTEDAIIKTQSAYSEEFNKLLGIGIKHPEQNLTVIQKLKEFEETKRKINSKILPTKNTFIARLAKAVGLKSIAKNLKRTDRDILSYFAFLIGGWIFDLIVGNLTRLIVEKLSSTAVWQNAASAIKNFVEHPILRSLGYGMETTKAFARALPSLNTLSGGYLGGVVGQNIAQSLGIAPQVGFAWGTGIGGGLGWGYQWALNLAKNPNLMNWMKQYGEVMTKLQNANTAQWQAAKQFGVNSNYTKLLKDDITSLAKTRADLISGLGAPGPVLRFAQWLNSPVGQFFRIPIKGLAVSQILSPFEADIRQFFPDYQGWMPPALQYFWEVKGAIWNTLFKPGFSKIWNFAKFNQFGKAKIATQRILDLKNIDDVGGLSSTRIPGKYYLDVGNGYFREVTPRAWYRQYLKMQTGWNNVFGPQGSFTLRINKFFEAHPHLNNLLRKIGVRNLNGGFIGFEAGMLISSWFGFNPLVGGLIGGTVGFFGFNTAMYGLYRAISSIAGYEAVGSAASFIGRFTSGFWIGTGIQAINGIFGLNLPFVGTGIFPFAVAAVTAFAPALISGLGFLIQPFAVGVGNFLVMSGVLASGAAASLGVLATILAVGTVSIMTIFIVFVVGSAFWIPLQEELQGLQPYSPCFEINAPIIDGNPDEPPIFHKNETKNICWTTRNKQDLYQGPIVKTKTFYPPENFSVKSHKITVAVPGEKPITWDNKTGIQDGPGGKYMLGELNLRNQAGLNVEVTGKEFRLTPPQDTNKQHCVDNTIKDLIDPIESDARNPDEIIADHRSQTIPQEIINDKFNDRFITYLRNPTEANKNRILEDIADYNTLRIDESVRRVLGPGITTSCLNIEDENLKIAAMPSPTPEFKKFPYESCPKILSQIRSGLDKNSLTSLANTFFNENQNLTPAQTEEKIKELSKNNSLTEQIRQQQDLYEKMVSALKNESRKNLTPEQKAQQNAQLAKEQCGNNDIYYLPKESMITVCLDVIYTGEDGSAATITEKDSATLPVLWPLNTNFCQAELPTFINSGPKNKIQWPVDNPKLSNGYQYNAANPKDNTNHTGNDFAGKYGDMVKSVTDGTVESVGYEKNGFGNYVIMRGGNGEYYIYGHLGNEVAGNENATYPKPAVGSKIKAGETIGYLGNSGNVTGSHLHFGISKDSSVKSFWNNSNTTSNPCLYFAGGCPIP